MGRKPLANPPNHHYSWPNTAPLGDNLDELAGFCGQYDFEDLSNGHCTPDLEKLYRAMQRAKPDIWDWWDRNG